MPARRAACCCCLRPHCTQVEADLARGASLEAFRRLLLLVLLQDPVLADAGPLSPPQLLTLEELLLALPPGTSEAGMLLSTVPSLLRMTNTGAAVISGACKRTAK